MPRCCAHLVLDNQREVVLVDDIEVKALIPNWVAAAIHVCAAAHGGLSAAQDAVRVLPPKPAKGRGAKEPQQGV